MQNNEFYENSEELENIIKIAAKEKLRLERQVVSHHQQVGVSSHSEDRDMIM